MNRAAASACEQLRATKKPQMVSGKKWLYFRADEVQVGAYWPK